MENLLIKLSKWCNKTFNEMFPIFIQLTLFIACASLLRQELDSKLLIYLIGFILISISIICIFATIYECGITKEISKK